jgi:hypothetical protein
MENETENTTTENATVPENTAVTENTAVSEQETKNTTEDVLCLNFDGTVELLYSKNGISRFNDELICGACKKDKNETDCKKKRIAELFNSKKKKSEKGKELAEILGLEN